MVAQLSTVNAILLSTFSVIGSLWSKGRQFPKFNQFFLVDRYIFGEIFTKIKPVVFTQSCQQTEKQTLGKHTSLVQVIISTNVVPKIITNTG